MITLSCVGALWHLRNAEAETPKQRRALRWKRLSLVFTIAALNIPKVIAVTVPLVVTLNNN